MTFSEVSSLIIAMVGAFTGLYAIWATRQKDVGNLADIYKKIANIDANTLLELKERLDDWERGIEIEVCQVLVVGGGHPPFIKATTVKVLGVHQKDTTKPMHRKTPREGD